MVFESIVVDLLNRFLGDYVQNLDKNQLKIGIWGGDVVLQNLQLKQTALDELDLPVQTVYGSLGKLVLKIPWKNLYTAPVEATIENLYLLASANLSVKYNEEKERKRELDAKRAELLRIEEAKRKENEKDAPKIDKSFTEKLVTQIINNVQIKIKDIHIRYEDNSSTREPFAFGITLSNLSVYTTDENWMKCFVSETITKVFKIAELDGLAVYFNSKSPLFRTKEEKEYPILFRETIASKSVNPKDFHYVLGPITSVAKLELNPNPENDNPPFVVPKIKLNLEMENLAIGVMKSQYQDLIQLAEMMDRMLKGSPYRQYRPYSTPYKGNAKIWWKFAINSVLLDVKRRARNWSWVNISLHRDGCRQYEIAYTTKMRAKKPSQDIVKQVDQLEEILDIFNLVIIRQKVDLEVQRELEKIESQPKSSWFGGWFGGSQTQSKLTDESDIKKQVQAALTNDEKAKLYRAIGYQENTAPTELPESFVAVQMHFVLKSLEVSVRNDDNIIDGEAERIVFLQLTNVLCDVVQRPSAAALKLDVAMQEFSIYGKKQGELLPVLARSKLGTTDRIALKVSFETNPLDKRCDQRVNVSSRPLQIVFDSQTVIELVDIFKPPKNLNISQIQDAASTKLDNIKERSATGLQHIVETHNKLEININLMPTFIVIPYNGLYLKNESAVIVVDMGHVVVSTDISKESPKNIQEMVKSGETSDKILEEMISQSYDRYNVEIQDIQILVSKMKEDWKATLVTAEKTEMHLLEPTTIKVSAHLCLINDDPRLPKTKVFCQIPHIRISATEERILQAISIQTSLPLPKSDEIEPMPLNKGSGLISSSRSIIKFLDDKSKNRKKKPETTPTDITDEVIQFTDLMVGFEMNELTVTLYRSRSAYTTPSDEYRTPVEEFSITSFASANTGLSQQSEVDYNPKLIVLQVKQLEMHMAQRTYDMTVALKLGALMLQQYHPGQEAFHIISTPRFDDNQEYLFSLHYTNAKKDGPEFATKYNSTEQLIDIGFSQLVVLLHQEAIIEVLQIASSFQSKLEAIVQKDDKPKDRIATIHDEGGIISAVKFTLPAIAEEQEIDVLRPSKKSKQNRTRVESIQIKVIAKLDRLTLKLENARRPISILNIHNLTAGVVSKSSYMEIMVWLEDIDVFDLNPITVHPKILSVIGDKALSCQLVLYNLNETADYNSDDIKLDVTMGCCRIVFLNWYVQSVLSFLDHFQAAQKAIADASAAAAEQAKQNMVDAYAHATRIKMNIKIKAPIIVVPVNTSSTEAICLDLGHLSITNMNLELDVNNPNGERAVIDEMKIELKDVKISKVETIEELDDAPTASRELRIHNLSNILNPTSFILNIQRNLSSAWFKDKPELNVSGRFKSIELMLMADNYTLLMRLLAENLTEGSDERTVLTAKPKSPVPPPNRSADKLWKVAQSKTVTQSKPFGIDVSPQKNIKIDTFLKFAFQMDSIIIHLHTTPLEGLATFGIHFLSVKGHKLVDDSLSTSVVLCDITLDDIRPNREHRITRFMKRREEDVQDFNRSMDTDLPSASLTQVPKSMIDLICNMRENDMFVDLRVFSFDLILSLDFLLKISNFFQVPTTDKKETEENKVVTKTVNTRPGTSIASTAQQSQPAVEEAPKRMTIILNVEQPEIVLVETMDDINCHAIVFNSEIGIKFRMIGDHQVLKGDVTDLNLYMCEFNPKRRALTKHHVLHPCTISLNGSTPEGKGLHLSLQVTKIKLCVSPSAIELLNKAMTTLTNQERLEDAVEKPPPDYSDIWKVERFTENDFWFIKPEEATDALSLEVAIPTQNKQELCIAEIPSIILIIETGTGHQTIPMLYIETSMQAQIHNWSWSMSIESSLRLAMSYYNSSMALWEPLIEPNERETESGLTVYGPWELTFSMDVVKCSSDESIDSENDDATTKINISSKDVLELTVTKTCLDVLSGLGAAFSEAIKPGGLFKPQVEAPYIVQNDTGFELTINLVDSSFLLHNLHLPNSGYALDEKTRNSVVFQTQRSTVDPFDVKTVKISSGGRAYLQLKPDIEHDASILSINTATANSHIKTLCVQVGDIKKELVLPMNKADQRYFPLYHDTNREPWGIVSDIVVEFGATIVTIHGIVQVHNHFTQPITVYRLQENNALLQIGEVNPDSVFNVPLHSIYGTKKEIFFSMQGYKTSIQGISWKENPSDFQMIRSLQCDPISTFEPFYMNAVRERKEIYQEVTSKFTMLSACYVIHLRPSLILKNTLPIALCVSVAGCSVPIKEVSESEQAELKEIDNKKSLMKEDFLDYGEKQVEPGEILHLPTVKTATRNETPNYIVVRLIQYLEKDWSCTTEIPANTPDFAVWTFSSYDSVEKMTLDLGIRYENRHGTLILSIYCPFWMINKTGLMLSYRGSDESTNILYHPPEYNGPILFSFREKNFFGKKKASIRVDTGDWSNKFSLDVAGSSGVIECDANSMTYQIAVHNTLAHNSLTKQIMFMPYYVLINKSHFAIEIQEDQRPADPWLTVAPNNSIPYWPKNKSNKMMKIRASDAADIAKSFDYTEVQDTLLRLENKYGGIHVDVHITEGGVFITFDGYHPGDAPVLLINHTDKKIKYWEKGNINERVIAAGEKSLYTWSDPAGDRIIYWHDGKSKTHVENDLRRDGVNKFKVFNSDESPSTSDSSVYWVSFLNGTQRVLLFTENEEIVNNAESTNQLDKVNQEIVIDIHGIGLSLVNNIKPCDVMYIGIASSGVIWEEMKKSRFKQMKILEVQMLEERYQEYLRDCMTGKNPGKRYYIDGEKIEVLFDKMLIRKSTERSIRRTFYPGLWLQMKTSPYQSQIHAKINRIQIDNQTADCIFPVVLAPVPPPKSVAQTTELKPFIECSIVQRVIPHSTVKQFKYLRVLMQEFHIKVDLMFINELFELLHTEVTDIQAAKQFAQDLDHLKEPLSAHVLVHTQAEQKNFYDQLHLGPLKIHVSFSMAGSESKALPGILSTILQGVGVTLTDINDVVFRLAFFEREYCFLTQRQLVSECVTHYSGQAVKQLYVLVLGLDVIGNPYGLVVGFTKGVEDLFYEPFQGAIQGPGEFAEGLVLGVRSLFGHTVGGAAGAVSKITGAMGKGIAALTFDKEYQKKRRDQMNKKPANLQEGLARSGKGLVMGVVDGVTGVVTKPISGAKSGGVEGFFKGLGKGAVGLVARPTAGIVDFASGSFEAVKRATEVGEDINRLRSPRFLHVDGVIRPYNLKEAEGSKLLKELEKGKYSNTDCFAHLEVIIEKREILLLSDHRLLYLTKNDLFGGWQVEWTYRWQELSTIRSSERGVEIVSTTKEGKKVLGLFGSSDNNKKVILIPQQARRETVTNIMLNLKAKEN